MSPFIVHQRPINKKKLIDVFRLSQGEQIVFQKKNLMLRYYSIIDNKPV